MSIELLSPAGSFDSLKAAVNAGCDSVYLGGKFFSARSSAANFSENELDEAVEFCHLHGVKAYLTVNTLYKEHELERVYNFALKAYEMGVDALIMQDLGLFSRLKPVLDLPFHASTQMTAHSKDDVIFLKALGFDRVVLSRELSFDEIKSIAKAVKDEGCELEVFVHGALCVAYSGRCLMSSMLGGRSGNRGNCAQPCRLAYALKKGQDELAEGYLLSPKDQMGLNILTDLRSVESKTKLSVKIEGRMKSPEYVYGVTKAYRLMLDNPDAFKKPDTMRSIERDLLQLFNRGGSFTPGYFKSYAGADMMSTKTPKSTGVFLGTVSEYNKKTGKTLIRVREDCIPGDGFEIWTKTEPHAGAGINKPVKAGEVLYSAVEGNIEKGDLVYKSYDKALTDKLKHDINNIERKMPIKGKAEAVVGEPIKMTLFWENHSITRTGPIVQQAQNRPLTPERIAEQLGKSGNTSFKLDIDVVCKGDVFINITDLNELRRECTDELIDLIVEKTRREPVTSAFTLESKKAKPSQNREISVFVNNLNQLAPIENISRVYIPSFSEYHVKLMHERGIEVFLALPAIDRGQSADIIKSYSDKVDGFLARNWGQLSMLKDTRTVADITFNALNSLTIDALSPYADIISVSPEITFESLEEMNYDNLELIAFGHQVLMYTHQCPIGLYAGEKSHGKFCKLKNQSEGFYLKDRKEFEFPILTDCENCCASILNGTRMDLLDRYAETLNLPIKSLRLTFTNEDEAEISQVLKAYIKAVELRKNVSLHSERATYGRYFRDVL